MNDLSFANLPKGQDRHRADAGRILRAPGVRVDIATIDELVDAWLTHAVKDRSLFWIARGSAAIEALCPFGLWQARTLQAGDFCLVSGTVPIRLRRKEGTSIPVEMMRVSLSPALLAQTVQDIVNRPLARFAFRDVMGERDDTLRGLMDALYVATRLREAPCPHFMASLAQAISAHLVRRYGRTGDIRGATHQGLPPYKLQLVINAMREFLDEPFDLGHLASLAGLSAFHFSRSFKKATGVSPSVYLTQLRMAEASRMLGECRHTILEVALAVGYRSPSHFSHVFRKTTGCSPTDYRHASGGPVPGRTALPDSHRPGSAVQGTGSQLDGLAAGCT
ncbi:helix-turn-helix domain-containing protein [Pseudoduganella lutea]|uniref:AraC family transcriptional regulator n=1 Tax=Pseudoduganella lutea TaxID=321985 RepID=A0A4P6L229_9BURK|nr:AraC family transcriptional regulator [Pseudoduganella lutea]QBE65394.1 AraC family transcriptional regulator [Pseudoduganella lutea]